MGSLGRMRGSQWGLQFVILWHGEAHHSLRASVLEADRSFLGQSCVSHGQMFGDRRALLFH